MITSANNTTNLEKLLLRIGLVGTSMILFGVGFDLSLLGEPFRHPLGLDLSLIAWGVGIALLAAALITKTDSWLAWFILASLVFVLLSQAYLTGLNYTPLIANHTDNEMVAPFAVQALRRGQNPYSWNYSDILRVYRDRGVLFTPFWDGTFQTRLTYPALPTLIFTVFDLFGIRQIRPILCAFHVLALCLVFVGVPTKLRPIVLLPLFLSKELIAFTLNGTQDIVWSAIMVGVILAWKRPVWRAVLFGLAAAFRQQPWFVAPFLLIYMWNESGTAAERRRGIVHFVGISVGVFLLANLPFIVWDPRAWWLGVFEPGYAPLNFYNHGLGALTQYGLAPFPRQFYNALQASSYVIMLALYWRHPRPVGQAFWIFPGISFWLFYHGAFNYWMYWIPPLLVSIARRLEEDAPFDPQAPKRSLRWTHTVALIVPILFANLLYGIVLFRHDPQIKASYSAPLQVTWHGQPFVDRVTVTVTNMSDRVFVPRFAVQRDPGIQALPWTIDSGPKELQPGQSEEFVISARIPVRAFPVEKGGQIIVRDAGGDYRQRAVLTIPANSSFVEPDLIANPDFSYWRDEGDAPEAWSLQTTANSLGIARIEPFNEQNALTIQLDQTSEACETSKASIARLAQTITFPTEFAIWVYPTIPCTRPLQQAYGLEIDDGEHKLWILFDNPDVRVMRYGRLGENFGYIYLPAPFETWSKQLVRPRDLYDLFGWQLPSFSLRRKNGLEYPARQMQLSLLLASQSRSTSLGVFGPIEQDDKLVEPDVYLAEALAHPDIYYINLGNEYHKQRNYSLAQGAYLKALTYNATSAEGYFGLAETSFWGDDWVEAIEAFEASIRYEYRQPALAYRGMGWSHYNLDQLDQAKRAFEQAVRIDPGLADAYNGLGWILLQENRCDEAVPHFERARALAPGFPDPQRGIEECARSP